MKKAYLVVGIVIFSLLLLWDMVFIGHFMTSSV